MIIAIDGPSGTGKSTVAKAVAKFLGFTFFDTGAMYRSFAWALINRGVDPAEIEKVNLELSSFRFEIRTNSKGEKSYYVDSVDVTEAIRSREISMTASQIAAYPAVRKSMVKMQRKFGRSCNAVFEGRDMGTVVFPDADLKIFLTASPAIRAERRYRELSEKFPDLSESLNPDQILQEIERRDKNDSSREISPLKQASDAVLIDTSNLTIDQVIELIIRLKSEKKTRLKSMKFSYWFIHSLARIFFKLFFRLKIYGADQIRQGAGLLIANHTSFYDPPVLSASCSEEVHFLARESLFRVPLLGRLIKMLNTHPVSHSASDVHVLRQMIQLLSEGKKLIIFPEGKRSPDGFIKPFERGFSFLAQKAKCTIYPAYISGAYKAWPSQRKLPKLCGKMVCVFGTPIEWDDFEDLPKKEIEALLTERCSQAILSLKTWLEEGAVGPIP